MRRPIPELIGTIPADATREGSPWQAVLNAEGKPEITPATDMEKVVVSVSPPPDDKRDVVGSFFCRTVPPDPAQTIVAVQEAVEREMARQALEAIAEGRTEVPIPYEQARKTLGLDAATDPTLDSLLSEVDRLRSKLLHVRSLCRSDDDADVTILAILDVVGEV